MIIALILYGIYILTGSKLKYRWRDENVKGAFLYD
jgi:hypothetical protein